MMRRRHGFRHNPLIEYSESGKVSPSSAATAWRFFPAVAGLIVLAAVGSLAQNKGFWTEQWFWIAATLLLSATVTEPAFTPARSALVNSVAALALVVAGDHFAGDGIWIPLAVLSVVVFATSLISLFSPPSKIASVCGRVAVRGGRASVLGTLALLTDLLSRVYQHQEGSTTLAIAEFFFLVLLFGDWRPIVAAALPQVASDSLVVAAIAPSLVQVAPTGLDAGYAIGERLRVSAGGSNAVAVVVDRRAHRDGVRLTLGLDRDWSDLVSAFPTKVDLAVVSGNDETLGFVVEGSDDTSIRFLPSRDVEVGTPVVIDGPEGALLYQVSSVSLAKSDWMSAAGVQSVATATQVGHPSDHAIAAAPYLPKPHQIVRSSAGISGTLEKTFHEVGTLKGTSFPIGVRTDEERRGHFAILGISGMGKTAAAQRLCKALGASHFSLVLDATGEYRSRLGFAKWDGSDFDTPGHFVFEIEGHDSIPKRTADLIQRVMVHASGEYIVGTPNQRVLLLEEAHALVPEFNNISWDDKTEVMRSTRFIMQARKFAMTFVIVSQRTAVVAKSAISQCENYMILRTIDKTSLEYLETVIGASMRDTVSSLRRWEAVCVGPVFNTDTPVIISLLPPPPDDVPKPSQSGLTAQSVVRDDLREARVEGSVWR